MTKEIEIEIHRMCASYKKKIESSELMILKIREEIKGNRKANIANSSIPSELAILRAQKQAYIQALSDFDSLLDLMHP